VIENVPLVVDLPFTSVALTVNVNVPEAEGVPDNNPEELKETPVGKAPDATVYVGASPESSVALS
jgi:hypothetical protein